MRKSIARTWGTALASLGLVVGLGAGIGSAAPPEQANQYTGDTADQTPELLPVTEPQRGGCDMGLLVDTYDHEPKAYGSGWLNCYDWSAYIGWLRVDLYRDGVHQGQGFCQMHEQMNCDAGFATDDPSGDQTWTVCGEYEAFPHVAPGWIYSDEACSTAVH